MSSHASVPGDSYPKLFIRLTRDVYAVRQLPGDLHPGVLVALAKSARDACKDLQMCLSLDPGHALYLYPNGSSACSPTPPRPAEVVEFRPDALAFLPGAGPSPVEEALRPVSPPAAPPPPACRPLIASPPAQYARVWRPKLNRLPARDWRASGGPRHAGVVRWVIFAGAIGRILLAHL